ncbi:MAG: glycosyltransferase [Cytophagales bacterium]
MDKPKYSLIVPVYNRPDEIKELLESLVPQSYDNYELLIVEDGSSIPCEDIVSQYQDSIEIRYFFKENAGPSYARNFGMDKALGEYFIFCDSDCILPKNYFQNIDEELKKEKVDAFGGPDRAHPSFNDLQKATSYAMTSFLTTGGIRGGKKKVDKFYPRSFNMGISKEVFEKVGGFPKTKMHPGEDMVFTIEIMRKGFKTKLLEDAYVFHKRRTSLAKFKKQVFNFGYTRVIISRLYPETFKIFYVFPSLFILGNLALLALGFYKPVFFTPISLYIVLLFLDALLKEKKPSVAFLSIATSLTQLWAYGTGFIKAWWDINVKGRDKFGVISRK